MGMFDSIYINVVCPYCGEESEMECQTKELDCNLEVFRKGGHIRTDKYNSLDCVADCMSKQCIEEQIKKVGYKSGFGMIFNITVIVNNGVITGEYKILNNDKTWHVKQ